MSAKTITTLVLLGAAVAGIAWWALVRNTRADSAVVGVRVGNTAPAFSITTTGGATLMSYSLLGKVVVLTSAAQWCATCQEEAREFAPVYEKYKDTPVVFITLDIDPRDTRTSIEQFRQTYATPWAYADAQGGAEAIRKYGMNRFEMTYIISPAGIVQFAGDVLTRPDVLDAEIRKTLAPPVTRTNSEPARAFAGV